MCCCNCKCNCVAVCQHCWHSTHEGAWFGVVPPDIRCCKCGILQSQLHGPYLNPYGGSWTISTSDNTIKITNNTGNEGTWTVSYPNK